MRDSLRVTTVNERCKARLDRRLDPASGRATCDEARGERHRRLCRILELGSGEHAGVADSADREPLELLIGAARRRELKGTCALTARRCRASGARGQLLVRTTNLDTDNIWPGPHAPRGWLLPETRFRLPAASSLPRGPQRLSNEEEEA
jgi:hypothetical protein